MWLKENNGLRPYFSIRTLSIKKLAYSEVIGWIPCDLELAIKSTGFSRAKWSSQECACTWCIELSGPSALLQELLSSEGLGEMSAG
jgi:hypothetical protein